MVCRGDVRPVLAHVETSDLQYSVSPAWGISGVACGGRERASMSLVQKENELSMSDYTAVTAEDATFSSGAENGEEGKQGIQTVDIEKQESIQEIGESKTKGKETKIGSWLRYLGFTYEEDSEEDVQIPSLSYFEVFRTFLWFGCRAFGGMVGNLINVFFEFRFKLSFSQVLWRRSHL